MTLTAEQAAAEGLPPGPPPSAPVLSAKDAEAEGLPSSPSSDSASDGPGLGERILHFLSDPPPATDKYKAFIKSASPPDVIGNDSPDWKVAIGEGLRSMPGITPPMGGEERFAKFEKDHPGVALLMGFAGPGGLKKAGVAGEAAQAGGGIMAKLRAWSEGLGQQVRDRATKAANATADSARGTLGAVTRDASSTLRDLSRTEALPASEIAANQASLATPEAQSLATDLAGKYREKLPGALDRMGNARALADQTAQDAAQAGTPEAVKQYADQVLKARTKTQLKRYALPVAGAAYGALSGNGAEDRAGRGALFGMAGAGLAGRALSPTFNAVVGNNLLAPERLYRVAPHLVSAAEKVAQLPASMLGRFAAPIQNALRRGPNALAAIHYKLSEDPEYQAITRKASEQQEAGNDGAAQ